MCIVLVAILFAMCSWVYSIRIGYCILVFSILLCVGVCGWNNRKGLCSKFVHINCVDRVVDGSHGW